MLTDTQIRQAKGTGKVQRLWDERGMYLEITPPGGKVWRFKYRINGKEKRLGLGRYPETGLKQARERREEARKLLADGIDPSLYRQAQKAAEVARTESTFEAIAQEWFKRFSPGWAASHSKVVIGRLEKYVFPMLGKRPIVEITAPELLAVIRNIEALGALATAHRTKSICGQVFRYAISTGRADRDPSADLKGSLPSPQGGHFAAITNPQRLGEILRMFDAYKGRASLTVSCALRLMPLVFVRPIELRKARWADIDLVKAEWRFSVSKTQTDHIVPLSRQAIAILKEAQPLTGHREWVFPGMSAQSRPMSETAILSALRAMGLDRTEVSGHGFRATARTLLDEVLRYRPDLIEAQLAHKVRDPNGRAYNRTTYLDERCEMMQQWADYLDELKGAK
jgi:integrase